MRGMTLIVRCITKLFGVFIVLAVLRVGEKL